MVEETLYIVMPAYNEEENIEKVIMEWYPLLNGKAETSRLIVADSGSTDKTHTILTQLQEKHSKLEVLSDTGKQHGPKLMKLYDYAIKRNADYVFQTDSDGQTSPEEFASFWNDRLKYDGIFGKRSIRGDGQARAFIEKIVCFFIKIYFNVCIPDANAPFRLMKVDVMKKHLYRLPNNYNLPNIMLTTYFAYYGEIIQFKEIPFKARRGGKNSINILKIIVIGWRALKSFRLLKKNMNKC